MTAQIIDGKDCSQRLLAEVKESVATLMKSDIVPGLAVVLVGDDAASQVYVRNKLKRCEEVGICSFEHRLPADTSEDQVLTLIDMLNHDSRVNGILVQLPLPPQINEVKVIDAIAPRKDVDGFTRSNVGGLSQGQKNILAPCTPSGCMRMLREQRDDLTGLHAVVIGCSNIVGKPMAAMLLAAGCTVSIAHSKTRDTAALTRQGDIVIVAVGRSGLVKADWIKSGAIVIDVGINRIEVDGRKRLVGDVDFTAVKNIASAITPVPGGVGPMTIACLLENTVNATLLQQGDHATANPNVGG